MKHGKMLILPPGTPIKPGYRLATSDERQEAELHLKDLAKKEEGPGAAHRAEMFLWGAELVADSTCILPIDEGHMQGTLIDLPEPVMQAPAPCKTQGEYLQEIRRLLGFRYSPVIMTNEYWERRNDPAVAKWFDWDTMFASAESYMGGSGVTKSRLTDWQKVAYQFTVAYPDKMLYIDAGANIWQIKRRGTDYTEFGRPHQDHGGENYWASRDGIYKFHTNED
jgi:hypothetical protein